jgi:hypothetical protein
MQQPGAHLVGSINADSADAAFRLTAEHMGAVVTRMPDGETGDRSVFTLSRVQVLSEHPDLEPAASAFAEGVELPRFRVREGRSAADVTFESLGYAAEALASYEVFRSLKEAGVIAPHVRFLVALPTPPPIISLLIDPPDRLALEPAVMAALEQEVATIAAAVPHDQLAIQWDVALELLWLESDGDFPMLAVYWEGEDLLEGIVERVARLSAAVPADVDLGYHLCYGDFGGRHPIEPRDARHLVAVSNGISEAVSRGIQFLQMPVPIERDDDAYFAPMAELRLHPETELYLGLLHHEDKREGAARRIATAQKYVSGFGVASECGLGRERAEVIAPLMDLHKDVAQSLGAAAARA